MRKLMIVVGLVAILLPASVFADDAPAGSAPPSGTVAMSAASSGTHSLKGASVWGILPWGGIGVGARFMVPVAIPSLLHSSSIKETWGVEFGGDFLHWSYGYLGTFNYSRNDIVPVVGLMWSLWLNEQFALYPKLELGYAFTTVSGWDNNLYGPTPTYGAFFWDVTGGAMYKLNSGITLRAEVGYAGLKLGVGFLF